MHVILKNQVTGETEGVLCLDRETGAAIVLQGDIERLGELVNIVFSYKIPDVKLIIPEAAVAELEAYGWERSSTLVVMYQKKGK